MPPCGCPLPLMGSEDWVLLHIYQVTMSGSQRHREKRDPPCSPSWKTRRNCGSVTYSGMSHVVLDREWPVGYDGTREVLLPLMTTRREVELRGGCSGLQVGGRRRACAAGCLEAEPFPASALLMCSQAPGQGAAVPGAQACVWSLPFHSQC